MSNHDSSQTDEQQPTPQDWRSLNDRLTAALKPTAPPVAISFLRKGSAAPVVRLSDAYAEPNDKGRTGQVPAGCVFWIKGSSSAFAPSAPDHANCSVGSFTHGFLTLEEAVKALDELARLWSHGVVSAPPVSSWAPAGRP